MSSLLDSLPVNTSLPILDIKWRLWGESINLELVLKLKLETFTYLEARKPGWFSESTVRTLLRVIWIVLFWVGRPVEHKAKVADHHTHHYFAEDHGLMLLAGGGDPSVPSNSRRHSAHARTHESTTAILSQRNHFLFLNIGWKLFCHYPSFVFYNKCRVFVFYLRKNSTMKWRWYF